jgi:hypothetical protein
MHFTNAKLNPRFQLVVVNIAHRGCENRMDRLTRQGSSTK